MPLRAFVVLSHVMKTALALLMMAQLVAPNMTIPQVMSAKFHGRLPIKAGRKANVTVSFNLMKGYKINREPTITLDLTPVAGVTLDAKSIEASSDRQEVEGRILRGPSDTERWCDGGKGRQVRAPGKLTYFFCSKSDGFCSKQTVDVKIPLQVE